MKLFGFAIAAAITLTACASAEKFASVMNGFTGKNADVLVQRMGPPEAEYPLSTGEKIMQWTYRGGTSTVVNGVTPNMAIASTTSHSCQIRFTVDQSNVIKSWNANGNSCKLK